jgi:hypothetical protein
MVVVQCATNNIAMVWKPFHNTISIFLLPIDDAHVACYGEMPSVMPSTKSIALKRLQQCILVWQHIAMRR